MGHCKTLEEALQKDAERFWSKVDKSPRPDGCWIWKGVRNKKTGRGKYNPVRFKGEYVRENRAIQQAHVWAWILTNGHRPIGHGLQRGSAGIILRHSCCNGHLGCVNPHHLAIGTQKENAAETSKAGRRVGQVLEKALAEIEERRRETALLLQEQQRLKAELKLAKLNLKEVRGTLKSVKAVLK